MEFGNDRFAYGYMHGIFVPKPEKTKLCEIWEQEKSCQPNIGWYRQKSKFWWIQNGGKNWCLYYWCYEKQRIQLMTSGFDVPCENSKQ